MNHIKIVQHEEPILRMACIERQQEYADNSKGFYGYRLGPRHIEIFVTTGSFNGKWTKDKVYVDSERFKGYCYITETLVPMEGNITLRLESTGKPDFYSEEKFTEKETLDYLYFIKQGATI